MGVTLHRVCHNESPAKATFKERGLSPPERKSLKAFVTYFMPPHLYTHLSKSGKLLQGRCALCWRPTSTHLRPSPVARAVRGGASPCGAGLLHAGGASPCGRGLSMQGRGFFMWGGASSCGAGLLCASRRSPPRHRHSASFANPLSCSPEAAVLNQEGLAPLPLPGEI